ncbi:adenylyl-sulfate kinase 3-like isoform X4 [Ziziphus jujuba]|uniref:Adenylyl-sulfate kinase 3-like isoform X4 n=1 Tax=Ziziphus jujuba TaxID=326968 RepID=A0ABM4A436_ZIZJJ|nr:adenylyl-sulfate kinase 3-like isoform X4 [Ziziphus jujuba]
MCCIDYGSQQIRKKFTGKSTLAYTVSRELHSKGKLSYVLDGDNLRHGLNKNLGFKPEDRTENIRRVDSGLICIASLISPYRKDRDACRAMLPDSNFIEVFMNMPLELCKLRDAKGLYKLARAGKIKGILLGTYLFYSFCLLEWIYLLLYFHSPCIYGYRV